MNSQNKWVHWVIDWRLGTVIMAQRVCYHYGRLLSLLALLKPVKVQYLFIHIHVDVHSIVVSTQTTQEYGCLGILNHWVISLLIKFISRIKECTVRENHNFHKSKQGTVKYFISPELPSSNFLWYTSDTLLTYNYPARWWQVLHWHPITCGM